MRRLSTTSLALLVISSIWILSYWNTSGIHLLTQNTNCLQNTLDLKDTYLLRKTKVESVCEKLPQMYLKSYQNYVQSRPLQKNWLYLPKYNLAYCWTRKVASTSWNQMFYFLHFNKTISAARAYTVADHLYPKDTFDTDAQCSTKFFFVRHPFERLVSCYRDKFEFGSKNDYIFKTFNPSQIKTTRPSFAEFVQYLIDTPVELFNDHWLPYWMHCQVCTQNYDIIGTMETLEEDVSYVFSQSNSTSTIEFPWSNKVNNKKSNSTFNLTLSYFNTLSIDAKYKLYELYLPDFQMFGYDALKYL